jgi:hypothetical protein
MELELFNQNENLDKLRELINKLDKSDIILYGDTLCNIENLIKKEKKIINNLKRSDTKLKHYEDICSGILSIISNKI